MSGLRRGFAASVLPIATLMALPTSAQSPAAAESEIRSTLEKWQTAFNDRDERHVCDLFAPDLIANYQGQPERDYDSLCQLLLISVQDSSRTFHYSFKIKEMLVYGEAAVVRLVWTLEIDKAGAPKEIIEEPAVDIFRRQADDSWKISRYLAYPALR